MDLVKASPRVQVVTEREEVQRLASAWNSLYTRASNPMVTQSFEWIWCLWNNLMRDARLRFIFVWREDQLVLVWPAVIVPYERFWTAEVPVAGGGDYVDYLVEDCNESGVYGQLAWQNRSPTADLVVLPRVRVSSLLHRVIAKQAPRPYLCLPGRYLDWDGYQDWTAYYGGLSERRAIARRRRRLEEHGEISFKVARDLEDVRSLSEWMFRNKEVWLTTRGATSPWVGSKDYEHFIHAISGELKTHGHLAVFAILLDGKTIAVQVCVVGTFQIVLLHNADDQQYRPFSPQHILTVYVLEWAYQQRLTVEFCVGPEPYKATFASADCPIEEFRIPNSPFGKLHECIVGMKRTRGAAFIRNLIR